MMIRNKYIYNFKNMLIIFLQYFYWVISIVANRKMISENCVLSQELLESCCIFFNRKYLSQKAMKMKAVFEWEQLILPEEQKELLKQICYRVSYAHVVYDSTFGTKY